MRRQKNCNEEQVLIEMEKKCVWSVTKSKSKVGLNILRKVQKQIIVNF